MAKRRRALGGLFGIADAVARAKPKPQSRKTLRKQGEKRSADTRRRDALYRRLGGPPSIKGELQRLAFIVDRVAQSQPEFARKNRGRPKAAIQSGDPKDRMILQKASELARDRRLTPDAALRAVVQEHEANGTLVPAQPGTHLRRIKRLRQRPLVRSREAIADALAGFGQKIGD